MKLIKNKINTNKQGISNYKYLFIVPIALIRELELTPDDELECVRLGDGIYIKRKIHDYYGGDNHGVKSSIK